MPDPAPSVQLSLLVPCFNEAQNLPEFTSRALNALEALGVPAEVVLVDDGSSDNTASVIRSLMAASPDLVLGGFHTKNQGIATAWQTALSASRGQVVVSIDADLQYQPEDVLRLYRKLLDSSVDIVQGWRSSAGREKGPRYHLSRTFNSLLNATFGMSLRDNKSGFVCCSREVFADLLTYSHDYHYWQSFIMVAAHSKGYSYQEAETIFEPRRQGLSFLEGSTVSASAKSLVDVARASVEYKFRNSPGDLSEQFLRKQSALTERRAPSPLAHPARWRAYMASFEQTHWMITRGVEHRYELLNRTQWLAGSQLRDLQDEKLRRLIRHAYRNVPYYRRRMQMAKLGPEDIRTQADLYKLPYLSKNEVRANLHLGITAENVGKAEMQRIVTSGSTGEPLVCFADRRQLEFRWAATLRAQEWTGYRFGDPCVRLWHQAIGLNRSQALKQRLDAIASNRTFVPMYEFSEGGVADMVRTMEDAEPVLIDGYAEALDFLARYLERTGGTLAVSPGAVMSSAQTLPAASRRIIEDRFACRVYDKYGSREFSGIAYECETHAGLHTVAESYIVEILVGDRPARPGETGEVVITDLNNFGMPFIRYRIGDLATALDASPCACGRGAPRIGSIQGRVQSMIAGTDARYVPGTFFAHALKEFDYAIRRFVVVQDTPGEIQLKIVKAGRFSSGALDEALSLIRKYLGDDLKIRVHFIESVELTATGKHMAVVSKLPVDFQKVGSAVVSAF